MAKIRPLRAGPSRHLKEEPTSSLAAGQGPRPPLGLRGQDKALPQVSATQCLTATQHRAERRWPRNVQPLQCQAQEQVHPKKLRRAEHRRQSLVQDGGAVGGRASQTGGCQRKGPWEPAVQGAGGLSHGQRNGQWLEMAIPQQSPEPQPQGVMD